MTSIQSDIIERGSRAISGLLRAKRQRECVVVWLFFLSVVTAAVSLPCVKEDINLNRSY